jgi:hypothetical protein
MFKLNCCAFANEHTVLDIYVFPDLIRICVSFIYKKKLKLSPFTKGSRNLYKPENAIKSRHFVWFQV